MDLRRLTFKPETQLFGWHYNPLKPKPHIIGKTTLQIAVVFCI